MKTKCLTPRWRRNSCWKSVVETEQCIAVFDLVILASFRQNKTERFFGPDGVVTWPPLACTNTIVFLQRWPLCDFRVSTTHVRPFGNTEPRECERDRSRVVQRSSSSSSSSSNTRSSPSKSISTPEHNTKHVYTYAYRVFFLNTPIPLLFLNNENLIPTTLSGGRIFLSSLKDFFAAIQSFFFSKPHFAR